MKNKTHITRRSALAKLGLGAFAAYVAPEVVGLSQAHASSNPSQSSAPTPPSKSSAPSSSEPRNKPSRPSSSGNSSAASRPSGPGACQLPRSNGEVRISSREYKRAQQAISKGEAKPLREVANSVLRQHPGRLVQVGYSESGAAPLYRMQIVTGGGAVLSVSVTAASGQIIKVRKC